MHEETVSSLNWTRRWEKALARAWFYGRLDRIASGDVL